jgi:hypothetical protein
VAKHGKKFSLISNVEAKKYGGVSDVTESQAEEVREPFEVPGAFMSHKCHQFFSA